MDKNKQIKKKKRKKENTQCQYLQGSVIFHHRPVLYKVFHGPAVRVCVCRRRSGANQKTKFIIYNLMIAYEYIYIVYIISIFFCIIYFHFYGYYIGISLL